jgi:hypothetical protein
MAKSNTRLELFILILRRIFQTRWFKTMVLIIIISLACLRIYRSCNKRKTAKESTNALVMVSDIQAIGKLELTKINIKEVLEHTLELDWAMDKKVLMVFGGEVVGCVDLSKIKEEQIDQKDSTITIILPATEICYSKIDHSKTKLYNLSTLAEFNKIEPEMVDYLYKKGEAYLVSDSMKVLIRKETEVNAQKILRPLLERITRKKVILTFDYKAVKP